MVDRRPEDLGSLVEIVRSSPKYRTVSASLIRRVGAAELAKGRGLKEAVKATKNKLHQVGGAYLEGEMRYASWLRELAEARASGDVEKLRAACLTTMERHVSTRERLPILDRFYAETLSVLPPVSSVLDVACGLNPLAIPWMQLAPGATYHACDVYEDLAAFVAQFLELMGLSGSAKACDIAAASPDFGLGHRVDLALVLKTIPCLEQIDRSAGSRLLEALDADHVLVTFPVHSLGGRSKGMVAHYEQRFRELTAGKDWSIRRFQFPTELAFLVST